MTETEGRVVVARGREWEKWGSVGKGCTLPVMRCVCSGDLVTAWWLELTILYHGLGSC